MNQLVNNNRKQLLQIFSDGLLQVHGTHCVEMYLSSFALPTETVYVVALGKAAASMMRGAMNVLGSRIQAGLVVTKYRHGATFPAYITMLEAAHPISDQNSLRAGQQLVEFVRACPEDVTLVVLLSGGTSALVEVLPPDMALADLVAMNQWLLSQPLTINQVNAVRKSVSMIKGGKLLNELHTPCCYQLILSDVPGNDLSMIGSGLFVATESPEPAFNLPAWIQKWIPKSQAPSSRSSKPINSVVLADNRTLCRTVSENAHAAGIPVVMEETMSGDAEQFARHVARQLEQGDAGLYIWGGETYLHLPESPGTGGRCQQIALAAAIELAGREHVILLAGASDGTDGPGDVAGAIIDGDTVRRGEDAGLNAVSCLSQADAGRFLDASGDLIDTGPTGTNVNDVVLAWKWAV